MAKIKFTAETNNRQIVVGREVRLQPGVNELEEDAIRKFGIDRLPFVTMPDDWQSAKPAMRTQTAPAKAEVTDTKPELKNTATGKTTEEEEQGANVLGEAMKAEQSKIDSRLNTPSHIAAMSVARALKTIQEIDSTKTLAEVVQMSNNKTVKQAAKKRIAKLDKDNVFGKE